MKAKRVKSTSSVADAPTIEGTIYKVPVIVKPPGNPKGITVDKIEITLGKSRILVPIPKGKSKIELAKTPIKKIAAKPKAKVKAKAKK